VLSFVSLEAYLHTNQTWVIVTSTQDMMHIKPWTISRLLWRYLFRDSLSTGTWAQNLESI